MNVLEKKVESQVQFWSLLGPFLILLSVIVLLFKVSAHWYFPLSALIGIPLCVKWKMKGMAVALTCLFTFSVIGYQAIELDERFWHVGMALAMAFSLIILTLSLEEVEGLVEKLQRESQSRLDNFLRLDEKMKGMEHGWFLEKEHIQGQLTALTQDMAQTIEEKHTFYKLMQLSKEELILLHSQHDQLLQELFYKKQQVAQLHEKLEEAEMTVQAFVNSESEQSRLKLKNDRDKWEQERALFKIQLEEAQWQKDRLLQDLSVLQEREERYLSEQSRYSQEEEKWRLLEQKQQEHLVALEEEKRLLQVLFDEVQQQCHEANRKLQEVKEESNRQYCEKLKSSMQQLEGQFEQEKQGLHQRHLAQQNQLHSQLDKLSHDLQKSLSLFSNQQEIIAHKDQELENLKRVAAKTHEAMKGCEETIQSQLDQVKLIEEQKQGLERELVQVRAQLVDYEEKLEIERENQKRLELLQSSKLELEQVLAHMSVKLQACQEELELVHENQETLECKLEQAAEVQEQMEVIQESKQRLESELAQVKGRLNTCEKELEKAAEEKVQLGGIQDSRQKLEAELAQMSVELSHCKVELNQALQEENKEIEAVTQSRKAEGMYLQLKEQFKQKSAVLDTTRKELFHTQEELLALKKRQEEQQQFAVWDEISLLEKDLQRMSDEYEKSICSYEQELDAMSQLIQELFTRS